MKLRSSQRTLIGAVLLSFGVLFYPDHRWYLWVLGAFCLGFFSVMVLDRD